MYKLENGFLAVFVYRKVGINFEYRDWKYSNINNGTR